MLSGSDPTEMTRFSNHHNLSTIEEEIETKTTSPNTTARRRLSTLMSPLTPPLTPNGKNKKAASTFDIKKLVVATTTISTAFGGESSCHTNLSVISEEMKDEDLPSFRVLFESAPDPQLILKPDSEFTIVAVNDAYLKATMTQRELILKKGLFEVFPDNPSDPKADGVCNLRDSLQQVIERGAADTMPIQKYDVRRPDAQGGEFEERYWSPINTPVFGNTGKVEFIIHRVEDVTHFIHLKQQETAQQTRAEALQVRSAQMEAELYNHSRDIQEKEEALKISHKRYRTLTSILPVGIFRTDLEGHCLYVNPHWQTMTGIPWEEAKNQQWLTLLQLADPMPVLTAWQQCQETGSCQVEFRFFGVNRKEYWTLAQLTAEQVGDEIKGYVGSLTNITELKELEQARIMAIQQTEEHQRKLAEAAEKHRKDQERFLDMVCHELRNPLNGMYGNVNLLQSNMFEMEEMIREASPHELQKTLQETILCQLKENEEPLRAIDQCARYQKIITDDVLNLSKLEAGKLEFNRVDFDLVKLVREAASLLEAQAKQKQIRLHLKLPSSHKRVNGDPNRLTQVLLNLLSNALKFTPEEGDVTVSLSVLEETPIHTVFQFSVKDTGIGMSEIEQNKLFDRFVQGSPKISAEHGGSGLGLVISKKLIELMEGNIEVKSEEGKGTEFNFTIKLAPALLLEEHESSAPVRNVRKFSPANRPLHILIAEDSQINQKILMKQLKEAGHVCHVANNGQEALEIYNKTALDLIFMDIEMPVMNGLEATQAIRQEEQASSRSRIPIIGLSGNARLEHEEKALGIGMNAYLIKPYDKEKLLEMIDQYASSVSPRAVTEDLSSKSVTLLSASTPVRRRRLNSSPVRETKENPARGVNNVKPKKKKEPKEIAPFWNNNKKLALASTITTLVGAAIGAGVTLAVTNK